MKFTETPIPGAYLVEIEPLEDLRGFFARTVCRDEFARHGLNADFIQQSVSFNKRRGTLRGLHFQRQPHGEEKLVRVTAGAIFDVIVDLRDGSAAKGAWFGAELSARNHAALYIPAGVAHGFQTLTDDAEVFYEMTVKFVPEAASGIRWDDPDLAVRWPNPDEVIMSDKDRVLPLLKELNNQKSEPL